MECRRMAEMRVSHIFGTAEGKCMSAKLDSVKSSRSIVCSGDGMLSCVPRAEILQMFVAWTREHSPDMGERPADSLSRFFADTWSCRR
jgi:hypothetical protein